MKPRQPIKTTAKRIGDSHKGIGTSSLKGVDVKPYGGYTPLSHKMEAATHIEQNYSMNVQNQLKLLKQISNVSTLNTSHMNTQLGQLDNELKQWEKEMKSNVKKNDSDLESRVHLLSSKSLGSRSNSVLNLSNITNASREDQIFDESFWIKRLSTYCQEQGNQTGNTLNSESASRSSESVSALLEVITKALRYSIEDYKHSETYMSLVKVLEDHNVYKETSESDKIEMMKNLMSEMTLDLKNNFKASFVSNGHKPSEKLEPRSALNLSKEAKKREVKLASLLLSEKRYNLATQIVNTLEVEKESLQRSAKQTLLKEKNREILLVKLQWLIEEVLTARTEMTSQKMVQTLLVRDAKSEEWIINYLKGFEQLKWSKVLVAITPRSVIDQLKESINTLYNNESKQMLMNESISHSRSHLQLNDYLKKREQYNQNEINTVKSFTEEFENTFTEKIDLNVSKSLETMEMPQLLNRELKRLEFLEGEGAVHTENTQLLKLWMSEIISIHETLKQHVLREINEKVAKQLYDYTHTQNEYNILNTPSSHSRWRQLHETVSEQYLSGTSKLLSVKYQSVFQRLMYQNKESGDGLTESYDIRNNTANLLKKLTSISQNLEDSVGYFDQNVRRQFQSLNGLKQLIQASNPHVSYRADSDKTSVSIDAKGELNKEIKYRTERLKVDSHIREEFVRLIQNDTNKSRLRLIHTRKEALHYSDDNQVDTKEITNLRRTNNSTVSKETAQNKMISPILIRYYKEFLNVIKGHEVGSFWISNNHILNRSTYHNRMKGRDHFNTTIQDDKREMLPQLSYNSLTLAKQGLLTEELSRIKTILLDKTTGQREKDETVQLVIQSFYQTLQEDTKHKAIRKILNYKSIESIKKSILESKSSKIFIEKLIQHLNDDHNFTSISSQSDFYRSYKTKLSDSNRSLKTLGYSINEKMIYMPLFSNNNVLVGEGAMGIHSLIKGPTRVLLEGLSKRSYKANHIYKNNHWSDQLFERARGLNNHHRSSLYTSNENDYKLNFTQGGLNDLHDYNQQLGDRHITHQSLLNNVYQQTVNNKVFQENTQDMTLNQPGLDNYTHTIMAYKLEANQEDSEKLTKQVLSQEEMITLIKEELALLKEEKQVEEVNIERLSEAVLREITHKIRKDRQRKGWI